MFRAPGLTSNVFALESFVDEVAAAAGADPLALRLLARLGGIDQRRVAEVLGLVGLAERSREPVRAYSLGMKQRLGVAAALLRPITVCH